jgi:hypothetical protein
MTFDGSDLIAPGFIIRRVGQGGQADAAVKQSLVVSVMSGKWDG